MLKNKKWNALPFVMSHRTYFSKVVFHNREVMNGLLLFVCFVWIYLPILCIAEIMVEVTSHWVKQGRLVHSAAGESILHQPSPPGLSIQALTDAIVWICAGIMSIWLAESSLNVFWTEPQALLFSLLAVLLPHRGSHLYQGVLDVP